MYAMVRFKLSVMMFLEFAIWGAWLPLTFLYLGELKFTALQQGLILNAFAVSSILAMFFSNEFVDRRFSAERFLAFSQLVGGLAILSLTWVTQFWPFFGLMLLHCVFYVPTISITNSIAFAHLKDPQKEFAQMRLWGTIGWIVVGIPFIFLLLDWKKVPPFSETNFVDWIGAILGDQAKLEADALIAMRSYIYLFAGVASLLLAGFSLLLPHTPPRPPKHAEDKVAWLEAVRLLRHPFIMVLFIVTFIDAAVHSAYFTYAAGYFKSIGIRDNWIMPVMSVGQFAEIAAMAVLGYCLKALGWRNIMVLGILGHTARFGCFALVPMPWVAIAVNVLHGICYAFFFATVYIFVDEFFPKDARTSAQGLFNLQILGTGPLVGNFLWPYLNGVYSTTEAYFLSADQVSTRNPDYVFFFFGHPVYNKTTVHYNELLLIPAGIALLAAIALFCLFHPPKKAADTAATPG